jgi:hypothetical protein
MKLIFKKNILLIFNLLIIIILFAIIYFTNKLSYNECFTNNDIVLVVSHYNEDLSYLNDEPFNQCKQKIYTKGLNNPTCEQCQTTEKLENIGVCVHTYLYYIIENYDNLPEVTIFLPGSCMDNNKKDKTISTINTTINTKDSVFYAQKTESNILDVLYDFTLDEWMSSNSNNRVLNNSNNLRKSDIRPFGKWYEENFPNTYINYITYHGIFSVSRNHIRQRTKESYQKLINYVDKNMNEESAHYFERSFLAIFHPIPEKCIYT